MPSQKTPRFEWIYPGWDAKWQEWQRIFGDLLGSIDATVFATMELGKIAAKQLPSVQIVAVPGGYEMQQAADAVFASRTLNTEMTLPAGNVTLETESFMAVTFTAGAVGPQTLAWEVLTPGVEIDASIVVLGYVDASYNITWYNGAVLTAGGVAQRLFEHAGGGADTVKVDAADTTADYLWNKVAAGSGVSLAVLNPGLNEQVEITADGLSGTDVVYVDAVNGSDVTGTGAPGRPYQTLSGAVAAVGQPANAPEFLTPLVFVLRPGTYSAAVTMPSRHRVAIVLEAAAITGTLSYDYDYTYWYGLSAATYPPEAYILGRQGYCTVDDINVVNANPGAGDLPQKFMWMDNVAYTGDIINEATGHITIDNGVLHLDMRRCECSGSGYVGGEYDPVTATENEIVLYGLWSDFDTKDVCGCFRISSALYCRFGNMDWDMDPTTGAGGYVSGIIDCSNSGRGCVGCAFDSGATKNWGTGGAARCDGMLLDDTSRYWVAQASVQPTLAGIGAYIYPISYSYLQVQAAVEYERFQGFEDSATRVLWVDTGAGADLTIDDAGGMVVYNGGEKWDYPTTTSLTADLTGMGAGDTRYYGVADDQGALAFSFGTSDYPAGTVPVARVHYDGAIYHLGDEISPALVDTGLREAHDRAYGACAVVSGGEVSSIAVDSDADADLEPAISDLVLAFYDREMAIANGVNNWDYLQNLTAGGASIPTYTRTGSTATTDWTRQTPRSVPWTNAALGRAQYDLDTAGTWGVAEATDGYFIGCALLATNNPLEPVVAVTTTQEYATSDAARTAIHQDIFEYMDGFPFRFAVLGLFVVQTASAYTGGSYYAMYREIVDARDLRVGPSRAYAQGHDALIGRVSLNAHPQYQLKVVYGEAITSAAARVVTIEDNDRTFIAVAGGGGAFAECQLPTAASCPGCRYTLQQMGEDARFTAQAGETISLPYTTPSQSVQTDVGMSTLTIYSNGVSGWFCLRGTGEWYDPATPTEISRFGGHADGAVTGNFAEFDSNDAIADSGYSPTSFMPAAAIFRGVNRVDTSATLASSDSDEAFISISGGSSPVVLTLPASPGTGVRYGFGVDSEALTIAPNGESFLTPQGVTASSLQSSVQGSWIELVFDGDYWSAEALTGHWVWDSAGQPLGVSDARGEQLEWRVPPLMDFARASDATFTVTDNGLNQDIFRKGRPIRYRATAGTWRYGIVTNYAAGTVTLAGYPLTTSDDDELEWGDMSRVEYRDFYIADSYGDDIQAALLATDMDRYARWLGGEAYVVRVDVKHKADATVSDAEMNFRVDGSAILSANLTPSTAWVSSTNTCDTDYELAHGSDFEVSCEAADDAGGGSHAQDLTVEIAIVKA